MGCGLAELLLLRAMAGEAPSAKHDTAVILVWLAPSLQTISGPLPIGIWESIRRILFLAHSGRPMRILAEGLPITELL